MEANNMNAIRDALVELMQFTCNSCQERLCESDCEEGGSPVPCSAILKARAALALPPRNCDVGTAEEQDARYNKLCEPLRSCGQCPVYVKARGVDHCEFVWGQMPYKESEVAK